MHSNSKAVVRGRLLFKSMILSLYSTSSQLLMKKVSGEKEWNSYDWDHWDKRMGYVDGKVL